MKIRRLLLSFGLCLTTIQAQPSLREGEWTLLNGADGIFSSLAAGEGVLVAVAAIGYPPEVSRSLDSGKTWRPFRVAAPPSPSPWGAIQVHFDPASKLFYCSHDSALYTATPTALAWTRLAEFPDPISRYSTDGPTLIVLANGVHVSQNGGRTWKATGYPTLGFNIMGFLAADSCAYISDPNTPLSVSCDGGNTWRPAGSGNLTNHTYAMVHHRKAVIASAGERMVRSLDRGRTWTAWTGNLVGGYPIIQMGQSGNSLFAWQVFDDMPRSRLHRSEDGGHSWTSVSLATTLESSITFLPEAVVNLGGLLFGYNRSYGMMSVVEAGKAWNPAPLGQIRRQIVSLGIHKNRYLAYTDQGVFLSEDTGSTWKIALGNDSATTWTAFGGTSPRFAVGSRNGEIRVTTDAGASWSSTFRLPQTTPVWSLAWLGQVFYAGTADALWRLGDEGGSWSKVPLPNGETPWILYAGRNSLLISAESHIWEMRGDGTLLDRTSGLDPLLVSGVWMVEDRLYASIRATGVLCQWNVEDAAWKPIQELTRPAYSIVGSGDRMVASSGHVSEDGGKTWHDLYAVPGHQSLFGPSIFSLTFSDGHVYGGDGRGGVWKFSSAFPVQPAGIPSRKGKRAVVKASTGMRIFIGGDARIDGRRIPEFKRLENAID